MAARIFLINQVFFPCGMTPRSRRPPLLSQHQSKAKIVFLENRFPFLSTCFIGRAPFRFSFSPCHHQE